MSKLWSLTTNDWVKGLLVAVLAAVLKVVYSALLSHSGINWQDVGGTALTAACAYILHQFGSDENGKVLGVF